jgi:hypothetical protein
MEGFLLSELPFEWKVSFEGKVSLEPQPRRAQRYCARGFSHAHAPVSDTLVFLGLDRAFFEILVLADTSNTTQHVLINEDYALMWTMTSPALWLAPACSHDLPQKKRNAQAVVFSAAIVTRRMHFNPQVSFCLQSSYGFAVDHHLEGQMCHILHRPLPPLAPTADAV